MSSLFRIDPETGHTPTAVDFFPNVAGNVMGLAINGERKFYTTDFTPDSFVYDLDPQTGAVVPILNIAMTFVQSIASRIPF